MKLGASAVGVAMACTTLAACASSSAATGPVTLNFYSFNDQSGAVQTAVTNCSKQSNGKYTITYNKLPAAADDQRLQLARRLAAQDSTMDILGLDVTWEAEFSQAGWILPWTGTYKQQAEAGTLKVPLQTATWKGQLVAVPYNSNTQLLWYRDDLVKTPPTTWDQMIADAEQLAKEGKPHLIEIQGAQYEGVTVWFNTLVASAGGSILTPSSANAAPGPAWLTALGTMKKLATSVAADPSLPVQMEDQNRLAMEGGKAAFELNYPFVYPSMKTLQPELFKHFKWALYPGIVPGQPARVTIGGIDLAVSKYSPNPDLAFQAALCLRDKPEPAARGHRGRPAADAREPVQRSRLVPRLPVPRRDPDLPAERQRAAADPGVPERLDRHLAPRVAALEHRPAEHRAGDGRRDQRGASVEVGDPVSATTGRVSRPASASGTHRRVKSR